MSRFEERIMELIHQLREEIRMNDQRIKQLSGGSGGGIDLTAIMLKAIYDQDEDGIVDNAKRLDGYTLEEILSQGGGKLVRVKADESGLEFVSPSAGELDDFLDLADTPSSYSGAGGKIVGVKADESGLEFITPSSGSGRNVIIDEAFNGLTVGNIAGQGSYAFASAWQAETSGTAQVVVKDGSDKCLEITANAGTSLNVKTIFSNKFGLTPGCRVSWKMKISSDVSGISGGVLIADATPTTRASVRFGYSSGLKLRVYNGSTNVDIMAASKDIWYQIDMIYFPSYSANGAILVWVDGVFQGVYANYGGIAAGGKGIQELRMYITSPSGSAEKIYIDDLFVEVYHPLEAA
ncbi:MAG: hypothetical protein QHH14_11485 [Clostridiales bacterium]|jgi:hypothetical protein|nr:hypothetical protein [Clostridiales bacterium]